MRCYSCTAFPGVHGPSCPATTATTVDPRISCVVRVLADNTVAYQGNVDGETGCTQDMINRYTFLPDKAFRAHPVGSKGGAKAACCNWDLCNGSWETATLTEEQYAEVQREEQFEYGSAVAAAIVLLPSRLVLS